MRIRHKLFHLFVVISSNWINFEFQLGALTREVRGKCLAWRGREMDAMASERNFENVFKICFWLWHFWFSSSKMRTSKIINNWYLWNFKSKIWILNHFRVICLKKSNIFKWKHWKYFIQKHWSIEIQCFRCLFLEFFDKTVTNKFSKFECFTFWPWIFLPKFDVFLLAFCVFECFWRFISIFYPFSPKTYIFRLHFLVGSANNELLRLVEILEQCFLVLQPQLLANDVEISNWIDLALDMSHVGVFESACDAKSEKFLLNLHSKPQGKIQLRNNFRR